MVLGDREQVVREQPIAVGQAYSLKGLARGVRHRRRQFDPNRPLDVLSRAFRSHPATCTEAERREAKGRVVRCDELLERSDPRHRGHQGYGSSGTRDDIHFRALVRRAARRFGRRQPASTVLPTSAMLGSRPQSPRDYERVVSWSGGTCSPTSARRSQPFQLAMMGLS